MNEAELLKRITINPGIFGGRRGRTAQNASAVFRRLGQVSKGSRLG